MKSTPLFVETLESRVAPAILVNGGNLLGGTGNPTSGETSSGSNTVTLIKVLSGQALVFYDASGATITGISVGKHTKLDITGNITGDIVTNLLPGGRLTDSDNNPANGEDGGILLPWGIKGVATHPEGTQENGDIGRIIAGGAVKNVNVNGSLSGLYAGDGIFRDGSTAVVDVGSIDYNTIQPGLQHTFTLTQSLAKSSSKANIENVVVTTADRLEIFAGSGSDNTDTTGGVGGSIVNVTITQTLSGQGNKPALFLHAGDGGSGTNGGAGGAISHFDDNGSSAYVKLQTGDGGAASSGNGGAGGSLQDSTIVTSSVRYDILMGHGGSGVTGGKGGSVGAVSFTNNILGTQSLIASGDFNNDGLQDVLLINTATSEGTLSLGSTALPDQPFVIALQPATNPDGTPGTTPFIAAEGAVPTSVVAVDLNSDGFADFVVSYASSDNLGVFLNRGDATFAGTSVALPASPTQIVAGDFSGTAAVDIAVLAGGDLASPNGGQNSQVFIAQGDGAGNLTVLANPLTLPGVGTALAAVQLDGTLGTDLFVGLHSGSIDPLFATGTSFTIGPSIGAFGVKVDSLDAIATSTGATLLAFSKNINANDATNTAITPQADVLSVSASGIASPANVFTPDPGAVKAHFVAGTGVVGVVSPAALSLYDLVDNQYTAVATLGSDGALNDFSAAFVGGTLHIVAVGAATNRFFYSTGVLGSTEGLPAFQHFNIPYEERSISFTGGDGGAGTAHDGGIGGSIKSLKYTQTLGQGVIEAGGDYNTFVTTGNGGSSAGGTGGRGGELSRVALSLNPAYVNDNQDDTDFASLTTGAGGDGATGGDGGSIFKTTSNTVFSDTKGDTVRFGSVAVQIKSGDGGTGTAQAGGAGGSVTLNGPKALSGVTFYDIDSKTPEAAALLVQAGAGGAGVTAGGAGGSLTNIGSQNDVIPGFNVARNELVSASIVAGRGGAASQGDGGAGGSVTGLKASVQRYYFGYVDDIPVTGGGWIAVAAGAGGDSSNGQGGAGGAVSKSTVASADGDTHRNFGVLVEGGAGGDGNQGGGAGGGIKKLVVNTPSDPNVFAAVVAAGDGGAATVTGVGGAGGSVKGISQSKDVNSAITAILGGSGGAAANGTGGAGGSIKGVSTVGFIGLPANDTDDLGVFVPQISAPDLSSLFADGTVSQGIFVGRGGSGAANGSVHNVTARQIAAIGAVVNEQGLFGVAAAVANVNADLIGYEVNRDNVFESSVAGNVSPSTAVPVDGFILAASVTGIDTIDAARTAAFTFVG